MPRTLTALAGAATMLALLPACALAQDARLDPGPPATDVTIAPGQRPPRPFPTPPPTPVVVSVGDSAISGEAGRWAGNTKLPASSVDALGPHAYDDDPSGTAETTPGCHRSKSAEVHIGGGVDSVNLACSGSKTGTYIEGSTGHFKPGIDFWNVGNQKGQAQLLQEYATAHPHAIKAVAVLIGANDYGFSEVARTCVEKFLWSPFAFKDFCQDEPNMTAMVSGPNVAAKTAAIKQAYQNVHAAMANAGYADSEYRIIAQTYSSPIPFGGGFRYSEVGYTRSAIGGCGIWDIDASWVNGMVLTFFNLSIRNAVAQSGLSNVDMLEARDAFAGRRLCENGVGLLEERGIGNWQDPRAVDQTEWVKQINQFDEHDPSFQENAHPNYWGQLALRNCFRQAYNNGVPHGGTCVRGTGLNSRGEPNMTLQ